MARILQDGFEAEGKQIGSDWEYGTDLKKLDVATFICDLPRYTTGNAHTSGVSTPRGGYGKKDIIFSKI